VAQGQAAKEEEAKPGMMPLRNGMCRLRVDFEL
jgi:hypothetical protein